MALERGLAVLAAFGIDRPAQTAGDIARQAGIDRSTARRMLHTLVELGFVAADGQAFRLHPSCMRLGRAYLEGLVLPELALGPLRGLSDDTSETALLGVLDGDDLVVVSHVPTRRLMSATPTVGDRFPARDTAGGRVLLAEPVPASQPSSNRGGVRYAIPESEAIRRQGYAISDQTLAGVRSIAAPVRDEHGAARAAVIVASHASRHTVAQLRSEVLPHLVRAVSRIEEDFLRRPGAP